MDTHDEAIGEFKSKVAWLFFLKFFLGIAAVWLFAWGTSVLVLRAAAGVPRVQLLWGFLGLGPVLFLAGLAARRRMPKTSAVRALLDGQSRCGGLLMASESADIGQWRQRMPGISVPSLRWRGRKTLALLAAGVVFVIIGFAVPQRFASMQDRHSLDIGKEADRLAAQIETLREEDIIDSEKARTLKEKLEQIEANASGEGPARTWEALDHMENQAAKKADEAAEEAVSQTEKLTKAQALAEGLKKDLGKMDGKTAAEAMGELAEMVKKACQENDALAEKLSEQLQDACEDGSLTPEQLEELADALAGRKGEIGEMLDNLCDAGLIDGQMVRLNEELGDYDCEGLADFLEENGEGMPVAELVDAWCRSCPGRGGITRGRGDAPMTWKNESDPQGAKFKEKALPKASLAALKDSRLLGLSSGAPQVGKTGIDPRTGALKTAAAGSGAAHTHTILPRHRGTIRRYFKRKDE